MKDLNAIYFTAQQLPVEERPAYLARACEGDRELRARVERMLALANRAEAFFTTIQPDAELENRKPAREPIEPIDLNTASTPDEQIGPADWTLQDPGAPRRRRLRRRVRR